MFLEGGCIGREHQCLCLVTGTFLLWLLGACPSSKYIICSLHSLPFCILKEQMEGSFQDICDSSLFIHVFIFLMRIHVGGTLSSQGKFLQ